MTKDRGRTTGEQGASGGAPNFGGATASGGAPNFGGAVSAGLASGVDHAFTALIRLLSQTSDARHMGNPYSFDAAIEFFKGRTDEELFPRIDSPTIAFERLPAGGERTQVAGEVTWKSRFRPIAPEAMGLFHAARENRTARAKVFLAAEPRPALVILHGYLGGGNPLEERALRVERLYRAGIDVALLVLPFHGLRAFSGRRLEPPFPSADPWATVEGVRQAIADVDTLVGALLARGAPSVGIAGVSLGGYLSALYATLSDRPSALGLVTPLASFGDFAKEHGTVADPARAEQLNALTSALHRRPKVGSDRAVVVVGQADRVTPRTHGDRLAAHFGCATVEVPGGHIMGLGFDKGWDAIGSRVLAGR